MNGKKRSYSYFVSEDQKSLAGLEVFFNNKLASTLYADQSLDPDLPATLGDRAR